MIDFVGAPAFLRIAIWVAIAIMHFHILAQTGLFLGNIFFFALRVPSELFDTHEKLSLGVQGRLN